VLNPYFKKYVPKLNYTILDYNIWDMNSKGWFYGFQRTMLRFMSHKVVDNTILLVVLLNMAFMSLDGIISDEYMDDQGLM
jgi:hypothetical protein